ncbi:MAG: response regulator [Thermoanaerobaculia bacterium]|nr:response regulator [Thermoanaerobaculia bacterium]
MPLSPILVVEDSPTERQLIQRALEGLGFRVVTLGDGNDIVKTVQRDKPGLILLDVVLPGANGFQLCRQLKTTPETKDVKVILLTSKAQESDRFWGMKQGADEYLTKPFKNDDLAAAVRRHFVD